MALVWVPALLRDLTGGVERVEADGETVRAVIDALEARYPGMRARLLEDDALRPEIALLVDGVSSRQRTRHKLQPDSELHFIPTISGGSGVGVHQGHSQ